MDANSIREKFGLPAITNDSSDVAQIRGCKQYDRYLADNPDILREMRDNLLQGENMLVADTGAGKTRTLFSLTEGNEWNIGIFVLWGLTDQASRKYEIQRLVGGDAVEIYDDVDNPEILGNKKMAVLIDMCSVLEENLRKLKRHGIDLKVQKGLVWVDEAHLIVNASTYRSRAINNLMSFLRFIREETSLGIVYTTATPYSCQLLSYKSLFFYERSQETSNIKEISEYCCKDDENIKDIIVSQIKEEIAQGHKVIIRANNVNLIRNLQEQVPRFEIITGDNKESIAYKSIVSESELNFEEYDALGLTCVLDAGISIEKVRGCELTDVTNIYVVDKHFNVTDLKQFSNRLRFDTKILLLVDKHVERDIFSVRTLQQIIEDKAYEYRKRYHDLRQLEPILLSMYGNRVMAYDKLDETLHERNFFGKPNNMGVFYVNKKRQELEYNYFALYSNILEEYNKQFFDCNSMRHNVLRDIFLVDDIVSKEVVVSGTKYIDKIGIQVDDFINDVANDTSLQAALKDNDHDAISKFMSEKCNNIPKKQKYILENKKIKKFKELMTIESAEEAASDVLNLNPQQIGRKISMHNKERLKNLDDMVIKEIKGYLKMNAKLKNEDAIWLVGSEFFYVYQEAYKAGMDLDEIQAAIRVGGVSSAENYMIEETIIRNNKKYLNSNRELARYSGRAGYEQGIVVNIIEKNKKGKTVRINEATMGKIQKALNKHTGSKWELKDVESFVKMIYTYVNIEGGLELRELRKSHSSVSDGSKIHTLPLKEVV